jgi:triphosphoribosyl-dephospho-CoA synthase
MRYALSGAADAAAQTPRAALARIGRAATAALYDELALAPKPGLVSFVDSGSHQDMDGRTFLRSLFALRHYFTAMVHLGSAGVAFSELQACGVAAEARMLQATGGVNTHRGAVFSLGLLCASAGAVCAAGQSLRPDRVQTRLLQQWGPALAERSHIASRLPGGVAARRHGLRGAVQEAALGFPVLFEQVAPVLMQASSGDMAAAQTARLDALFHAMAVLDDTNLVHRGGLAGLHFAQTRARQYLAQGGTASDPDRVRAQALHRQFMARRLSPGGAADMLAAACWLQRVCVAAH